MAFSIHFTNDPLEFLSDDPSIPSAVGQIIAGDFIEEFSSTLYEWTQNDYRKQWRQAIENLLNGGLKTALFTEYLDRTNTTHCKAWVLYRSSTTIFMQEHLLFYEQMPLTFSAERVSDFIRDRQTRTMTVCHYRSGSSH